jgi:hypothetical protein
MYDKEYSLADPTAPGNNSAGGRSTTSSSSSESSGSGTWTPKLRSHLAELGRKVQRSLSDPDTPNEQKVLGFSNMLHEEWIKAHPKRTDTARALNMMYCRIVRETAAGATESADRSQQRNRWNPRFNQVLRQCVEEQNKKPPVSHSAFWQLVVARWRENMPEGRQVSDEALRRRIVDLTSVGGGERGTSRRKSDSSATPSSSAAASRSNSVEMTPHPATDGSLSSAMAMRPGPNARGQMCWNKRVIRDLFDCHQRGLRRRQRCLLASSKRDAPVLSTLVHEEFLRLHPYCKLTPAILMAKLYCWKNALNKGTLDLSSEEAEKENEGSGLASPPTDDSVDPTIVKTEANGLDVSAVPPSSGIIYRTWSQPMMDDLLATRKSAMGRKQKLAECGQPCDLLDLWHEEFVKLHPEYKSTKKNLMQKYKWYRSRMRKKSQDQPVQPVKMEPTSMYSAENYHHKPHLSQHPPIKIRNIRKDVFLHIKALMEESRIFLPMKLPKEQDLKQESGISPPATMLAPTMQLQTSMAKPLPVMLPQVPAPIFLPNHPLAPALVTESPSSATLSAAKTLAEFHEQAAAAANPIAIFSNAQPSCAPPSITISVTSPPVTSNSFGILAPPPVSNHLSMTTPELPLNLSLPSHIKSGNVVSSSKETPAGDKKDTIKLPGGATLVAVTDRNADLLKPKPVEKPHVTITIGDKGKAVSASSPSVTDTPIGQTVGPLTVPPGLAVAAAAANQSIYPEEILLRQQPQLPPQPIQQHQQATSAPPPIVLSVPRFPLPNRDHPSLPNAPTFATMTQVPSTTTCMPPAALAQLRPIIPAGLQVAKPHNGGGRAYITQQQPSFVLPFGQALLPSSPLAYTPKAIFIPSRVKARLDEFGMTDQHFIQLLQVYERARNEYIDTLKRGNLYWFYSKI